MKKLFQFLGIEQVKGDVGVEIEVEGARLGEHNSDFWRTEDDGSLRGVYPNSRAEYIFKEPLPVSQVGAAMDELIDYFGERNSRLDFSFRTSVHVHVNAQGLTEEQLLSFVYAYLLLEEPLMTYCGRERKGNRFCLRLADAEGLMDFLNDLFDTGFKWIENHPRDALRYAAINLEALRKYGSVEFRGMRGNADKELITNWTQALINIREYACKVKNPQEVYEAFAANGPIAFFNDVLGDVAPAFNYARVERDIQNAFSLTLELPYSYMASVKRRNEAKAAPRAKKPAAPRVRDVQIIQAPRRFDEVFRAEAAPAPRPVRPQEHPMYGHMHEAAGVKIYFNGEQWVTERKWHEEQEMLAFMEEEREGEF